MGAEMSSRMIQVPEMVNWLKHNSYNNAMTDAHYKSVARHILNMPAEARMHFMVTLSNMSHKAGHDEISPCYGVFQPDTEYIQTQRTGEQRTWTVIKRTGDHLMIKISGTYAMFGKTVQVCSETGTEYIEFKSGKVSATDVHLTVQGVWK
jgi:hypothetical protein